MSCPKWSHFQLESLRARIRPPSVGHQSNHLNFFGQKETADVRPRWIANTLICVDGSHLKLAVALHHRVRTPLLLIPGLFATIIKLQGTQNCIWPEASPQPAPSNGMPVSRHRTF